MEEIKITDTIKYIGVNDKDLDLFEGQYVVPNGMAYNSYLIKDEKYVIMDTVDSRKTDEWINNLESKLDGKEPDYLVISHVEPDHSRKYWISCKQISKNEISWKHKNICIFKTIL